MGNISPRPVITRLEKCGRLLVMALLLGRLSASEGDCRAASSVRGGICHLFAFLPGAPCSRMRSIRRSLTGGAVQGLRAALSLRVVQISKTKEKWADTACDDYASRVRKMGIDLEEVLLKPAPGPPKFTPEQTKDEEGRTLLSRVDMTSEKLIILDERGDMLTSHQLADLLRKNEDEGVRTLTFAIGGAHGHGQEVQAKAHRALSLSKMVMNHQIARVVLMEQLYRAYTILKGVPYHK